MNIQLSAEDLAPLVEKIVKEVIGQTPKSDGNTARLGYREDEAASLLGVERHVLRDARLRGELQASRIGKRIIYTPEQLQSFLSRNRWKSK